MKLYYKFKIYKELFAQVLKYSYMYFDFWLQQRVNSLGQFLNINSTQKKGKHKLDNKFMETLPKAIIENTANHDEKTRVKLKANQLENELKTVALEWKSSRNMEECGCSTTFDAFNKKVKFDNLFRSFHLFSSTFVSASLLVLRLRTVYEMHDGAH